MYKYWKKEYTLQTIFLKITVKDVFNMSSKAKISFLIMWIFFSSTGIIAIFTSNLFIYSSVTNICNTSKIDFKELPPMSWTTAWNESGNPIITRDPDQNYYQICSDGAGGAIIVWQEYDSTTN